MIRVNDVIEMNGAQYRVVQRFGSLALMIAMTGQSVDLIDVDADELDELMKGGRILLKRDEWADLPYRKVTDGMRRTAMEGYEAIKSIVSNPELYRREGRRRLVQAVSGGDRQLERRLSLLIATYWRRGQTPFALIPDYGHNAGRVASGAKRGRKGRAGAAGAAPSPELLNAMDAACRSYEESNGSLTLKAAYAQLCEAWEESKRNEFDNSTNGNDEASSREEIAIPSYHQFYYFYRTRYGTLSEKASE